MSYYLQTEHIEQCINKCERFLANKNDKEGQELIKQARMELSRIRSVDSARVDEGLMR